MKNAIGLERKIDKLGRIVIPKEIRRKLDIKTKDILRFYEDNGKIYVQPKSTKEAEDMIEGMKKSILDNPQLSDETRSKMLLDLGYMQMNLQKK